MQYSNDTLKHLCCRDYQDQRRRKRTELRIGNENSLQRYLMQPVNCNYRYRPLKSAGSKGMMVFRHAICLFVLIILIPLSPPPPTLSLRIWTCLLKKCIIQRIIFLPFILIKTIFCHSSPLLCHPKSQRTEQSVYDSHLNFQTSRTPCNTKK